MAKAKEFAASGGGCNPYRMISLVGTIGSDIAFGSTTVGFMNTPHFHSLVRSKELTSPSHQPPATLIVEIARFREAVFKLKTVQTAQNPLYHSN